MGTLAKCAAILLLPLVLSACAGGAEEGKPITFTDDRGVSNQPFPKNYRPEDVAAAVRFLCGPGARYINGQAIHANGGAYLGA